MARPSKYQPEYAAQAEKLCRLGATDADLAEFFEVSVRTIANWQTQNPEFLQALKAGKVEADNRVERSLYQRAVGYTFDAVKIFMPAGAKEPVYAEYREHIPPDTTAQIFWLKNRRPEEWRDKTERTVRVEGEREEAVSSLTPEEREAIKRVLERHRGEPGSVVGGDKPH